MRLNGPYHSQDRAEIDRRIAWLAERGVREINVDWIPPVGEQPPILGDEARGKIRVIGTAMLEWARACEITGPADEVRAQLLTVVSTAKRVQGEPDPRDVSGHTVRYRARSRTTGIDLTAHVSYASGTYTVEVVQVEGYGLRIPPIARRTEQQEISTRSKDDDGDE
jgi:hypothetical protein